MISDIQRDIEDVHRTLQDLKDVCEKKTVTQLFAVLLTHDGEPTVAGSGNWHSYPVAAAFLMEEFSAHARGER